MTRFIDISVGIGSGLITWPGDPPVEVRATSRLARGDAANVSELRLGTHTGTHVDPPVHFIDGAASVDRLALNVLVGEAVVADFRGLRGEIGPAELEARDLPPGTARVLLATDNSEIWRRRPPEFPSEYVSLSPEGARWVVARGIRLVGIDFLSIEKRASPDHPTHRALLEAGVVIVEGLDLSDVEPGRYTLVCLPLKVLGGDGAPARAILTRERPRA